MDSSKCAECKRVFEEGDLVRGFDEFEFCSNGCLFDFMVDYFDVTEKVYHRG